MGVAPVRHCEGGLLIILKRDLLRQHNVADRKGPLRAEAPSDSAQALFVELVHIHLTGLADAITLAAVAARHLEMPMILILCELSRG